MTCSAAAVHLAKCTFLIRTFPLQTVPWRTITCVSMWMLKGSNAPGGRNAFALDQQAMGGHGGRMSGPASTVLPLVYISIARGDTDASFSSSSLNHQMEGLLVKMMRNTH